MKKIPYARQLIDKNDIKAVCGVLGADYLTQGPKVSEFESIIASYCQTKYAVAVSSGTAALHLACLAAELKKDDEVITSPITFVASSNAILYTGAKPVFADIDEKDVCIDVEQIAKKINSKTRAIIPVDFAGHPCDLEKIKAVAKRNKCIIIEDAAHALGAKYKGKIIGSQRYSDMTILSFHAVKNITTGEGGAILTNNKKIYDKLIMLRSHGITRDPKFLKKRHASWYYEMQYLGFNYRLTDVQCALGISQFTKLDYFLQRRKEIVSKYNDSFKNIDEILPLQNKDFAESANHLYILRFKFNKFKCRKEKIFEEYHKNGILVNFHYIPVYLQPYYQKLGYKRGICPKAEQYYRQALTLPLYPAMSDSDVKRVINITKKIIREFRS
ncbi:MAG: UDP-4-amino-4,6-dideoxy-N-acetyl-beta-L-altrosamine transaminase [Candidatus Omnitrophica bacterium]|jgi:UDP-4-amino-4,6-dideoxy-N-acetyl-beta-L-altrosamine transaminase|nr:UDP-4-amino-4,6-dideoxy-N-acetyl-beta-L-altrosamine transaminase [Candidatus Omnitrophota bacterium]